MRKMEKLKKGMIISYKEFKNTNKGVKTNTKKELILDIYNKDGIEFIKARNIDTDEEYTFYSQKYNYLFNYKRLYEFNIIK